MMYKILLYILLSCQKHRNIMHYNDAATGSASSTHTYIRVSCTVNFRIKVYFVYRFNMYIQTSREAAKSIRFRSRRVSFYLFVGICLSLSLSLSVSLSLFRSCHKRNYHCDGTEVAAATHGLSQTIKHFLCA